MESGRLPRRNWAFLNVPCIARSNNTIWNNGPILPHIHPISHVGTEFL
jgi:hypothetical protein